YVGDLATARREYLAVLERAPRHGEIAERLAWIDALAGDRSEAALATIVEVRPATDAGVLGGGLLVAVGDADGGAAAFLRGAGQEPFGPVAALTWLRAARVSRDAAARRRCLDEGIARAPALAPVRWARLEACLDVADVRTAKADAEHLEAAASGSHAR